MSSRPRPKTAPSFPGTKWGPQARHPSASVQRGASAHKPVSRRRVLLIFLVLSAVVGLPLGFRPRPWQDMHRFELELVPETANGNTTAAPAPAAAPATAEAPAARVRVKNGTVAVCLAGGLRAFQLTATSIAQHFLSAYQGCHVFVHAPLDDNSHKLLFLLRPHTPEDLDGPRGSAAPAGPGWQLKGVKFLAQGPLDETAPTAMLLSSLGSPNGVQGLLQYFQLVEGCYDLITRAEESQGFLYDWVVRTRPDGFWAGPPPPLAQLDPRGYTLPAGSDWGGANDRIGITKRFLAERTLRRLSALGALVGHVSSHRLNSETGLKAQLVLGHIPARRANFPFCTLTHHTYSWPPRRWQVPVFSLGSSAPLNAAKCRPCAPSAVGARALKILTGLKPGYSLPYRLLPDGTGRNVSLPYRSGQGASNHNHSISGTYDFCDPSKPWPSNWPTYFDRDAGEASAAARKEYKRLTRAECVSRLAATLDRADFYDGPSSEVLCALKDWGLWKLQPPVVFGPINCSSVVYSIYSGAGPKKKGLSSKSWEKGAIEKTGATAIVLWKPRDVSILKLHAYKMGWCGKNAGTRWYAHKVVQVLGGGKLTLIPKTGRAPKATSHISHAAAVRVGSIDLLEYFLQGLEAFPMLPACQVILPVEGTPEKKTHIMEAMREKGFVQLKCTGAYSRQSCLFMHNTLQYCTD